MLTGSKQYVPGQTQPAGAKQGVGDGSTSALEAMNFLTPSSNSTVTCLSPKEKKTFCRLFLRTAAISLKEAKNLDPNTGFLLVKFP